MSMMSMFHSFELPDSEPDPSPAPGSTWREAIGGMLLMLLGLGAVCYGLKAGGCIMRVEGEMEYIYVVTPGDKVVMKSQTNTGVILGAHHLVWTDLDGTYHHYRVSDPNTAFILLEPHERYEKGKRKWLLSTAEP